VLAEKRQGQCGIFSSTAVIAMNEKRIHSKTAIREAKSDAKKEERIGSVMDEINERLPLQESINAPWPPRVSSGATISSSPSSTLPGSRATYVPPDLNPFPPAGERACAPVAMAMPSEARVSVEVIATSNHFTEP
jgi:hypothetical protein